MTDQRTIKWGIIGASYIGKTAMIPAIKALPDARVVSLYSSDPDRGRRYAEENGIHGCHSSLDAFLADPEVEAVYIGSRNDHHREQAVAAARAGKHVLCDKPLALTVADAREMVAAAAAAGVQFGVNHHIRSHTANRKLRELLRAGAIGKPVAARARFAGWLAEHWRGWRNDNPAAGAGVIFDLTVHTADTLRFVLDDEVEEVAAMTVNQGMTAPGIEDGVMGVMRLRSGILAEFHDAFTVPHDVTGLQILGTEGSLYADDNLTQAPSGRLTLRRDGHTTEVPVGPTEDPYQHLLRELNQAIRGAGQPFCTGQDGVKSLAIAVAALESARTRGTVKVQAEYP
jgi:1,5-anhydro-D-fructose reductase (1,5-anhydro-D-mannitol-forming)